MTRELIEFTNIVYLLIMLSSGYGFALFAWWWRVMGRASEIYAYVTLLFLGILISASAGLYSRLLHCFNNVYYHEFIFTYWWSVGPCIVLVVLLAINFRMTRRVLKWRSGNLKKKCPHCGSVHSTRSRKKGVENV